MDVTSLGYNLGKYLFFKKKQMFTFSFACLMALLFCHPIMFFNDEWITGNQLHQMSPGSQILYNEGKYGTYENGTPFTYFELRQNSLPYTSYLPLVSTPVLNIIYLIGDHLPYFLTIFWISLALFLFLLLTKTSNTCLSTYNSIIKALILSVILLFFLLNLITYSSLSISGKTDSTEVIAVVLFHIFLYSLFATVIISINRIMFPHPTQVLFGTVTSLCCSSALFWTTTLKDHLDVMFSVSLLIYTIILHIRTRDPWYGICTFVISGLVLWIRPEFGAFVIASLVIIYWPVMLINRGTIPIKMLITLLISPLFTLLGTTQLFINNFLVMGNPFKFPWQMASDYVVVGDETVSLTANIVSETGSSFIDGNIIHNIISLFVQRMTPGGDVISGMFSVFLYPESLKVPVFGIIPIFLLSTLLIPFLIIYLKKSFSSEEIQIIFILGSLSVATFFAYISSITGLGTSIGIFPDVRYLSPLYLPLTLIGLIIIMKFDIPYQTFLIMVRNIGIITCVGVCILLITVSGLYPEYGYSDFFLWVNVTTTLLVFITLGITYILFTLSGMGIISNRFRYLFLSILIALPFIWQISQLIIINFSDNLFDQYPPLLPAVRAFFEFLTQTSIG